MICVGYPSPNQDRVWCTYHQRWHWPGDIDISHATGLFFDALEQLDNGYYDRHSGVVDMQAVDIVRALLAAGWRPAARH